MTQDELVNHLKSIADDYWQSKKTPIFLSQLVPTLIARAGNADFRVALGTQTLKSFIKSTSEMGRYRLIEHPTQIAKVALAPIDAEFEFSQSGTTEGVSNAIPTQRRPNKAIALLDILSTLPDEEIQKITIPISVLVKLSRQ